MPSDQSSSQHSPISWVLVGCLVFCVGRLMLGDVQTVLGDPDTYLHISIGNWVRLHHYVPLTDPFSFPMVDKPWVAHEWLSGVLMSYIYEYFGWYGLCVMTILACTLTLAVMARYLLRYLPPIYVLALLFMIESGLESHMVARPHVLVWPLMVIWVSRLLVRCEFGQAPSFWLLPLMALWANLHGSFVLGLGLIPFFAFEAWLNAPSQSRTRVLIFWLLFGVLAGLFALATPYGWSGLSFAGNLVSINSIKSISEWQPVNVKTQPMPIIWLGIFLVLGLRGWLKLPFTRLFLLLGLGWQMMAHTRFYSIFVLLTPLLVAVPFEQSRQSWLISSAQKETAFDRFCTWTSGPSRWWAVALSIPLLLSGIYWSWQKGIEPGKQHSPREAVAFVQQSKIQGNVLNHYDYGGYLIWSGIPVFMDGRVDLRGDQGMKAYDQALSNAVSKGLTQLLSDYQIAWTILPKNGVGVLHMDRESGWKRIYEDDLTVVHAQK